MIEILGARTGNCLRVSVALEEAGIAYVVRRVDLRRAEHLGDAFRTINPEGKVPVMVEETADGGRFVLTQSNAILLHIAERAPGTLLPVDARDRALALQRFFWVLTDVIGPNHSAFRLSMQEPADAGIEVLRRFSARMLASAEAFLAEAPFLSGAVFGLADIAAVTTLSTVLTDADLAALPRLTAWHRRTAVRDSVVRGMGAFDQPSGGARQSGL